MEWASTCLVLRCLSYDRRSRQLHMHDQLHFGRHNLQQGTFADVCCQKRRLRHTVTGGRDFVDCMLNINSANGLEDACHNYSRQHQIRKTSAVTFVAIAVDGNEEFGDLSNSGYHAHQP